MVMVEYDKVSWEGSKSVSWVDVWNGECCWIPWFSGSEFQIARPATENAPSLNLVLVLGTVKLLLPEERSRWWNEVILTGVSSQYFADVQRTKTVLTTYWFDLSIERDTGTALPVWPLTTAKSTRSKDSEDLQYDIVAGPLSQICMF